MDGSWTKKWSVNQKKRKSKKEEESYLCKIGRRKNKDVYPSNLEYGPYHIGAVLCGYDSFVIHFSKLHKLPNSKIHL